MEYLSARNQTSVYIREFTQGRNRINVINVGKISARNRALEYIKETLEYIGVQGIGHECKEYGKTWSQKSNLRIQKKTHRRVP